MFHQLWIEPDEQPKWYKTIVVAVIKKHGSRSFKVQYPETDSDNNQIYDENNMKVYLAIDEISLGTKQTIIARNSTQLAR